MARVPGSAGIPLVSDKSYDFYKDPIRFQQKHMESTKSRVFLSRFLNKPTIFIGSNKVLQQILTEGNPCMEMGYKAYMGEIYGDNIVFSDGDAAEGLREVLGQLFTPDSLATYQDTIERTVEQSLATLESAHPTCIYSFFKRLSLETCLGLFLGLDFSQSEADVISQITTTHWHGIISVPVAVKLPMISESTYGKALDAKRRLLKVIQQRRDEKRHLFPQQVEGLPGLGDAHINNHLLLFTSALAPKAISSILTSVLLELGQSQNVGLQDAILEDNDLLDSVLLETLRLYPPFQGGRRIITQDFTAGGYQLPAGNAVLYLTYAAHRDPDVFPDPDHFIPARWHNQNKADRDKLFCFGAGPRRCLGQTLVWSLVKSVLLKLMNQYKFAVAEGQDLAYKWLPVARPRNRVLVEFEQRTSKGQAPGL